MSNGVLIVSGCDSKYFPLLKDLIASIKKSTGGPLPPFACFDFGLEQEQREWLKKAGIDISIPRNDLNLHSSVEDSEKWRPFTVRPFIPKYFPGFEVYVWIDADVWVQNWVGIEMYIAGARRSGLAITPEVDRSYPFHLDSFQWSRNIYSLAFGDEAANRYPLHALLNNGIFAMSRDAPHWCPAPL